MGLLNIFGYAQRGHATTERKPKPEGWTSKVISKLTVAPGRSDPNKPGKFTIFSRNRPEPSIEILPDDRIRLRPEHRLRKELMPPPPSWYKSSWVPGALSAVAFSLVVLYLYLSLK